MYGIIAHFKGLCRILLDAMFLKFNSLSTMKLEIVLNIFRQPWALFVAIFTTLSILCVDISPVKAAETEELAAEFAPIPVSEPAVASDTSLPSGDFNDVAITSLDDGSISPELKFPEDSNTHTVNELSETSVIQRDEFSTTFSGLNGTRLLQISDSAVNMQLDSGVWVPISTDVAPQSDGTWEAVNHPLAPEFSRNSADSETLSVSNGEDALSMTLLGAAESEITASVLPFGTDGHDALYEEVFPGADLVYDVQPSAIKEVLILNEPSSTNAWTWRINTGELRLGRVSYIRSQTRIAANTTPARYVTASLS
ncbi:hypothetical protein C8A06_1546 [Microbacteriaceae bacterium MWH-Ta3]|nr:hypothetical protein C8A06_1546 [Microbacteriaceae bacterium MWH-Ta3]